MNLFKRIFKTDEYKIIRKDFGNGFANKEMVMIDKFIIFIRRSKKEFNSQIDNYFEHPDWEKFSKVITEILEHYRHNGDFLTFKTIINKEKDIYTSTWKSLSDDERTKIQILAERFDQDDLFIETK